MNEFQLIDVIIEALGDSASASLMPTGPGDDCSVTTVSAGAELVSSIDTLLADVHFPAKAAAGLIGYRAMMVSLSDLVAMGATPRFVMIALTLPDAVEAWVRDLAAGIARAAQVSGAVVAGGNLARGPLSISVSVHGEVPAGTALLRSGAQAGDGVYLSGPVGGAAHAVARGKLEQFTSVVSLDVPARAYFMPSPPFHLVEEVRSLASAAIDVSDGLLQDLGHLAKASKVGINLIGEDIPLVESVPLETAIHGSDDYVLCFTSGENIDLPGITRIGTVVAEPGIRLDGVVRDATGYQHFA
jgi:thiamine-monophosphate kinase